MSHVVLFHAGLGLTSHVKAWAARIEQAGHTVTTPDLYDGAVFDNLADGIAKRDEIGVPELSKRAADAVADLPLDLVYAGFSLGAISAEASALMRPGARGAILMNGCFPPQMLGADAWPGSVKMQVHSAVDDEWVDSTAIDALEGLAPAGAVTRYEYDGGAHLFGFEGYSDYNEEHAEAMAARVLEFIESLDD